MAETLLADNRPKQFALVLMPFDKAFDDVYRYGIRAVCERVGLHCERVDEQNFDGTILDRIYNQIAKADIIVADMTGRNANVFYETGYAHALGKRVVLLTQSQDDIPFDLLQHPHIIYAGRVVDLDPALEKRLTWLIENPLESLSRVDLPLEFFFGAVNLADRKPISVPCSNVGRIDFPLILHNAGHRTIEPGQLQLTLASSGAFLAMSPGHFVPLPTGQHLHILDRVPRLFPDCWAELAFAVQQRGPLDPDQSYEFTLRLYTEIGLREYPITLVCNKT